MLGLVGVNGQAVHFLRTQGSRTQGISDLGFWAEHGDLANDDAAAGRPLVKLMPSSASFCRRSVPPSSLLHTTPTSNMGRFGHQAMSGKFLYLFSSQLRRQSLELLDP